MEVHSILQHEFGKALCYELNCGHSFKTGFVQNAADFLNGQFLRLSIVDMIKVEIFTCDFFGQGQIDQKAFIIRFLLFLRKVQRNIKNS